MFDAIGALYIDHVAVTTRDLERTARDYMSLPGARLLRGPGWNPDQKVWFCFVQFGDLVVEILGLPEDGDSPIAAHLETGGGAYHLCFACHDIAGAVALAEQQGCKLVVAPRADAAFDGRAVAFLIHPAHGLFEIVEASPGFAVAPGDGAPAKAGAAPKPAVIGAPRDHLAASLQSDGDSRDRLADLFVSVLRLQRRSDAFKAVAGETKGWDSLGHLRLVMAVEEAFEVNVPSSRMSELTSFEIIADFIAGRE